MALTLYFHPLSSFCWKALIPLYENGTPFKPQIVNFMDAQEAAAFKAMWPIRKFPVLRDDASDRMIAESSIIVEYLDQHYPGPTRFIPADPELAREVRLRDRIYDMHLHLPMQKVVGDWLRPEDKRDPHGVEEARAMMRTVLDLFEPDMATRTWAAGETFTMADCAASPALFYANKVMAFGETHPATAKYLERLMQRPSFARVLAEAQPYFTMFPG